MCTLRTTMTNYVLKVLDPCGFSMSKGRRTTTCSIPIHHSSTPFLVVKHETSNLQYKKTCPFQPFTAAHGKKIKLRNMNKYQFWLSTGGFWLRIWGSPTFEGEIVLDPRVARLPLASKAAAIRPAPPAFVADMCGSRPGWPTRGAVSLRHYRPETVAAIRLCGWKCIVSRV